MQKLCTNIAIAICLCSAGLASAQREAAGNRAFDKAEQMLHIARDGLVDSALDKIASAGDGFLKAQGIDDPTRFVMLIKNVRENQTEEETVDDGRRGKVPLSLNYDRKNKKWITTTPHFYFEYQSKDDILPRYITEIQLLLALEASHIFGIEDNAKARAFAKRFLAWLDEDGPQPALRLKYLQGVQPDVWNSAIIDNLDQSVTIVEPRINLSYGKYGQREKWVPVSKDSDLNQICQRFSNERNALLLGRSQAVLGRVDFLFATLALIGSDGFVSPHSTGGFRSATDEDYVADRDQAIFLLVCENIDPYGIRSAFKQRKAIKAEVFSNANIPIPAIQTDAYTDLDGACNYFNPRTESRAGKIEMNPDLQRFTVEFNSDGKISGFRRGALDSISHLVCL